MTQAIDTPRGHRGDDRAGLYRPVKTGVLPWRQGTVAGDHPMPGQPPQQPSPDVDGSEAVLEVTIVWGTSILQVCHLAPGAFTVGEALDAHDAPLANYVMSAESLGTPMLPVTRVTSAGLSVVIPSDATGIATLPHARRGSTARGLAPHSVDLGELEAQGLLSASSLGPGFRECPLPEGASVEFTHREFTFVVRSVLAGRVVGRKAHLGLGAGGAYLFGAAVLSSLFLAMLNLLPPRGSTLSLDLLNADDRYSSYLAVAASRQEPADPSWIRDVKGSQKAGGSGADSSESEGESGLPTKARQRRRTSANASVDGPAQLARSEARSLAASAGIVGLLRSVAGTGAAGTGAAATSPYGAERATGSDAMAALGSLLAGPPGQDFGFGGLGARGTGRGAGGDGRGVVGLGRVRTRGDGRDGSGTGYGRDVGALGVHVARVPRVRPGRAQVRGGLSKEVIRRVIRRHVGEVRHCYEQALIGRPDLQGRVGMKFIIGPSGVVRAASVASSSLGDKGAERCLTRAVQRWSFPSPSEGGVVVVTYPFSFARAGG